MCGGFPGNKSLAEAPKKLFSGVEENGSSLIANIFSRG